MKLASRAESQRIDELSQKDFDLPAEILMEAAGALAAKEIASERAAQRQAPLAIVCGPGGNGGDALVVARHLHAMGFGSLKVCLLAPEKKRSALFFTQLARLARLRRSAHVDILDLLEVGEPSADFFQPFSSVVDGVFGIGLRDKVEAPFAGWLHALNSARAVRSASLTVIALDAPSGLDVDRGVALGQAVRSDLTLTFGLAKPGFFLSDGPAHVGRLRVLPIGFPRKVLASVATSVSLFTEAQARASLPRRSPTANKTAFGRALVMAGSRGMWGAGVLAATAAYRTGAGYVTLASHQEPVGIIARHPEVLTATVADEGIWKKNWSVAVIGPGFGTGPETAKILRRLKDQFSAPVVADADAITVIAGEKLFPLPANWVLTPHAGELSRLIGVDAETIESDRLRYAREAARLVCCRVLLKGFHTVVADVDGHCLIVPSGNSALAKAGSGDVLTGMIAGLLAQGLPPGQAAAAGAYIHGRMADEWLRSGRDRRTMSANDLRDILPHLMARIASSRKPWR